MAVTAPIKPISERDSPSLCIHNVSTEPCNTHGKPLENPRMSIVRKRRSSRGLSVEINEDMAAIAFKHKAIPVIRALCKLVYYKLVEPFCSFPGSENYWKNRYSQGGSSGDGSYDLLASFKAEIINSLVRQHNVGSVIEFGCGDGNQLVLAEYPRYLGVDISPEAIALCRHRFSGDNSKSFIALSDFEQEYAEMSMSLDVIYHLVENAVFQEYMSRLFSSATRFVVIYSSNTDSQEKLQGKHIRHRQFTSWINEQMNEWELLQHIPNRYPYSGDDNIGSFADFYIYQRLNQ